MSAGQSKRVKLRRLCDQIEMRALVYQTVISRDVDVHSHSINGEILISESRAVRPGGSD